MEDTEKLIAPFDKKTYSTALVVFPFILGGLFLVFLGTYMIQNLLGIYFIFVVRALVLTIGSLFLLGYVHTLFFLIKNNAPAAILSPKGIWIKNFGFIPWQDINEFSHYIVPTTPIVNIGIRVKDVSKLSKQASFAGKCAIFWSKILGYPPIILSNLALDNDTVLDFSRRYLR